MDRASPHYDAVHISKKQNYVASLLHKQGSMQFLFVTLETEGVDSTSDNILVSNLCEQVDWLALSPGSFA